MTVKIVNNTEQPKMLGTLVHNGVWEHEEGKDRLFWIGRDSTTLEAMAIYAEEETGKLRTMRFEDWIDGGLTLADDQPRVVSPLDPSFYCCSGTPTTLGRWRHFKGGEYFALRLAKHAITGDAMVVYVGINGGVVWVRALDEWSQRLPDHKNVYRFTRLDSPDQNFSEVPAELITHGAITDSMKNEMLAATGVLLS